MIPTTVSTSSLAVTASISMSNSNNGCSNNTQQSSSTTVSSVLIGIASLILEGRPIVADEYKAQVVLNATERSDSPSLASSSPRSMFNGSESSSIYAGNGHQSPKPSTSRAALNVGASGNAINITTNPHVFNCFSAGATAATSALFIDPYGSNLSSSSAESTQQRWAQKLCQLRQASPAANVSTVYDQKVAAEAQGGEPELLALAVNESDPECSNGGGDFDIVRRIIINRATVPSSTSNTRTTSIGSTSSSPGSGSDNFLHSLQSLATTCLRVGNPPIECGGYRYSALSTLPLTTTDLMKHTYQDASSRFQNTVTTNVSDSVNGVGSGTQSPRSAWLSPATKNVKNNNFNNCQIPTGTTPASSSNLKVVLSSATTTAQTIKGASCPKQGPHCDQFLRKIGLSKGEVSDSEDHFCDMSYINIICSRWQAYCHKIKTIISRGDSVCIEVYLGPVGHKILLEQWILTQREKAPPPTMTLTSLCCAIRSQLYFSQISAWCDLIKNSDNTVNDTGRIIFPTPTGAAGDLAIHATPSSGNVSNVSTTPSTSAPSPPPSRYNFCRPRLNIFYRIKQYDSTACFKSKPNIHNFPNVNISENCSISVCLKSLPRINGGIPRVGAGMTVTGEGANNAMTSNSNSNVTTSSEIPKTSRNVDNSAIYSICDSKKSHDSVSMLASESNVGSYRSMLFIEEQTVEKKENVGNGNEVELPTECDDSREEEDDAAIYTNISHREKQLLKYRKFIQKRDKKQKSIPNTQLHAEHQLDMPLKTNYKGQPMDQSEEETDSILHISTRQSVQMISTGTQTQSNCCQTCGREKILACPKCSNIYQDEDNHLNEINETESSSISSSDIIHTPRNKAEMLLQAIQRTPKAAKHKKQLHAGTTVCVSPLVPKTRLQNNNHSGVSAPYAGVGCQVCKRQKTQHNFGSERSKTIDLNADNDENDDDGKDEVCQNFLDACKETIINGESSQLMEEESFITSTKLTPHIDRCSLSLKLPYKCLQERVGDGGDNALSTFNDVNACTTSSLVSALHLVTCNDHAEQIFKTPTNNDQQQQRQVSQGNQQQGFQNKRTTKINLLQVSLKYHDDPACGDCLTAHPNSTSTFSTFESTPKNVNPVVLRKGLPKVNLTQIFCNAPPTSTVSLSSPTPTDNCGFNTTASFSFNKTILSHSMQQINAVTVAISNSIPVQKSFSAPTLPNSPSLSPRFSKKAAFYKRRSRHLSDRSDRSSLGSDEQISDEDFENNGNSPSNSPIKYRSRIAALFGRMPLLGNLEESLLQKRLLPKIEVMGFKVLLGASGGFCPTQLTIPASANFYELHGETLSTPYVCDIRLPRKGYSVPRTGTVQATLLNPMGTVVRMFVIPYDMRDMPPLHQTFIRQRILAEASINDLQRSNISDKKKNTNSSTNCTHLKNEYICEEGKEAKFLNYPINSDCYKRNKDEHKYSIPSSSTVHVENNFGHFISTEHMKRLRYSIHLRFQTSRSGRLSLHTDIRLLISRRTDCDTAAAHAKGVLEAPSDLVTNTVMPTNPKYSARQENSSTTNKI